MADWNTFLLDSKIEQLRSKFRYIYEGESNWKWWCGDLYYTRRAAVWYVLCSSTEREQALKWDQIKIMTQVKAKAIANGSESQDKCEKLNLFEYVAEGTWMNELYIVHRLVVINVKITSRIYEKSRHYERWQIGQISSTYHDYNHVISKIQISKHENVLKTVWKFIFFCEFFHRVPTSKHSKTWINHVRKKKGKEGLWRT